MQMGCQRERPALHINISLTECFCSMCVLYCIGALKRRQGARCAREAYVPNPNPVSSFKVGIHKPGRRKHGSDGELLLASRPACRKPAKQWPMAKPCRPRELPAKYLHL
jgi:hypothetical protein